MSSPEEKEYVRSEGGRARCYLKRHLIKQAGAQQVTFDGKKAIAIIGKIRWTWRVVSKEGTDFLLEVESQEKVP